MNKKVQIITNQQFLILCILIMVIVLIFGNGGLSSKIIVFLIFLFLVNPVLSFFVNVGINALGFRWLEEINLTWEIEGYEFSITAYALLSTILGLILFG